MRVRLTIIGELCEAWRLADCVEIKSFGWDGSTKFQIELCSPSRSHTPDRMR